MNVETRRQTTRVAAYGLVTRGREILLCRLSAQVPRYAGQWTLPGGGVEFGEHPEAAMLREITEETGLSVTSCGVAGVNSLLINGRDGDHHALRIIYHTKNPVGELRNETDGTTDLVAWHHVNALGNTLHSELHGTLHGELNRAQMNELVRTGLELAFP